MQVVTDCDYCGEITLVEADGSGGKACATCLREIEAGLPISYHQPKQRRWSLNGRSDLSEADIDRLVDEDEIRFGF